MGYIALVMALIIGGAVAYTQLGDTAPVSTTNNDSEQGNVLDAIDEAENVKNILEDRDADVADSMTDTVGESDENVTKETESTMTNENNSNTEPAVVGTTKTALVAGGCFWCVEADLEKLPGVLEAVSGYAGGSTENPTYQNYGKGGHREVVEVTYDPSMVSFEEILIYAMKHMDPTDPDGSFGDRGVYYSPAFYYDTLNEKETIEALISEVDQNGPYDKPLAIAVEQRPTFWSAEDYHQDYYKGTLSGLKYKYYRNASGRDDFIEQYWGNDTGPELSWRESGGAGASNAAWQGFDKPSDDELEAELTAMQYKVTQKNGTEPAFSNEYWDNKEEGIYVDIVSGEPLFSSTHKFDSGTGWPSFTRPIDYDFVSEHADYKLIVPRTEIRSSIADSHLGHVFNDAPKELGGIRYCMNSASLRFVAKTDMEAEGYSDFLYLFN